MNWSSRSLASSLHHAVFQVLVRCRCMPVAHALLAVVVAYYTLLPSVRARALPYITHRFKPTSWLETQKHVWRLYKTFGDILLTRTVAGVTGRLPSPPDPKELDSLAEVLRHKRGCIVLSAHVGAWQLGLAGLETLGVPINLLHHRDPGDVDRHYFERTSGHAVRIINSMGPFGGMLECAAALRRGEIVCIMGDRLMSENEACRSVSFLGDRAAFPVTPYLLASLAETPLVLSFSRYHPEGIRGRIIKIISVPPGLRKNADRVLPFLSEFVEAMQAFVAEHPYQFFNFYDMWTRHDKE